MTLFWTESLAAPRSLATRDTLAVTVIEDTGAVDLHLHPDDHAARSAISGRLGIALPEKPWSAAGADGVRIVWIGPNRFRLLTLRETVAPVMSALVDAGPDAVITDMTGAFASFRIVGPTAFELLLRVCPLDLRAVARDEARGTAIAGVNSLLLRESGPVESWLVLVPRSRAEHVATALVEAARTPGRLALFEPAAPPPV